jgi:phosphopantetheinyl transferase
MPLLYKKDIAAGQSLGLWQIAESSEDLLQLLGAQPAGFERYLQLSHESRRQQWLAARVLLQELTGSKEACIDYDRYNKPFVNGKQVRISISHSYGMVAVVADEMNETGIDIELIKPKIERIAGKFMSDEEMSSLDKLHHIEALYVHWCAKEALYKLYGKKELIFKENLHVHPFAYEEKGEIKGSIVCDDHEGDYRLRYEKTGDHMLVYVLNG